MRQERREHASRSPLALRALELLVPFASVPFAPVLCALVLVLAAAQPRSASAGSAPDAHAPIGVMGDHLHKQGELMVSYRYMRMRMEGNRSGRSSLTPAQVLAQGFMVTPTDMDMEMQMWGLMYAPTDRITLMAMVPYVRLSMDHVTGMGGAFSTRSRGVGDISLTALIGLYAEGAHQLHMGIGIVAPTGSIRREDRTPMGVVRLPYPMQPGSGSWSLAPSLTYRGVRDAWSWGGQVGGTFRLNENDLDYRLGHRAELTGWLARRWSEWLSNSFRLGYEHWSNIRGADPVLVPTLVPTADPDRRGGDRLDAIVGANLIVPHGALAGVRAALEFAFPITQSLDGPQLENDWNVTLGLQYAF